MSGCVNRLLTSLVFVIALGLVPGCQPGEDQHPYIERLSDALDREIPELPAPILPAPPARREMRLVIEPQQIETLQFAKLHRCNLGALIGERNSPLGRLQTDSQRLFYELTWLRDGPSCVAEGEDWLTPVLAAKAEQLPRYLWNASFATEEMASALGSSALGSGVLDAEQSWQNGPTLVVLADALKTLSSIDHESAHDELSASDYEHRLKALMDTVRLGRRRHVWSQFRQLLERASLALRERQPPVCLSGQPTPRSDRVVAVFRRYYVADLQPMMSRELQQDREAVIAINRAYESLKSVAPQPFVQWFQKTLAIDATDSEWQQTQQVIVLHAEAWQKFIAQCGYQLTDLVAKAYDEAAIDRES